MTNVFDQMGVGKGPPPGQAPAFGQRPSSILSNISQGVGRTGQRIVISGVEKVGKTTLACNAPRALLVPLEIGYAAMGVPKTPMLTSFEDVMSLIAEVKDQAQRGQFQPLSLVFDSATALERLIHDAVLRRDPAYMQKNAKALTMEAALGGYGKAYQFANELFDQFTKACDELAVYGGINIILTCHVFAAKVIDPAYGEYDTWDLLLHSPKNQKNYGKREMITQWADMVGFLHEPLFITKGEGMNQATSLNRGRVLAVDRTPGYVAGNRYGVSGLIPIPPVNGWNSVAHAIYNASGIDTFNRDV
jgi:hypothetical protein